MEYHTACGLPQIVHSLPAICHTLVKEVHLDLMLRSSLINPGKMEVSKYVRFKLSEYMKTAFLLYLYLVF